MQDTITRFISGIPAALVRAALQPILNSLADQVSSVALASAGLVISTDTFTAKIGATDFYAIAQGRLVKIAAATAMPTLPATFTVANAQFNVVVFTVNGAGTVSANLGTSAATLGGVVFPPEQYLSATVGFIILNPTVGTFTGGSTVLSGTSANAVYVSPVGAWEATINI